MDTWFPAPHTRMRESFSIRPDEILIYYCLPSPVSWRVRGECYGKIDRFSFLLESRRVFALIFHSICLHWVNLCDTVDTRRTPALPHCRAKDLLNWISHILWLNYIAPNTGATKSIRWWSSRAACIATSNRITCNFSLLFFDFIFFPPNEPDSKIYLLPCWRRHRLCDLNWRWRWSTPSPSPVIRWMDILFSIINHSMLSRVKPKLRWYVTSHTLPNIPKYPHADKTHKLIQLATHFSS